MRESVSRSIRRAVAERAANRCEYCQTPGDFSASPLSIEHITPQSRGGSSTVENLCLSCQGCNNHKYTRTFAHDPVSDRQVPFFHPRKHRWAEHFAWSPSAMEVVPLTAIGRATVELLRLNRPGVVGLRGALASIGKHPPLQI
jgi:hypothetical protein